MHLQLNSYAKPSDHILSHIKGVKKEPNRLHFVFLISRPQVLGSSKFLCLSPIKSGELWGVELCKILDCINFDVKFPCDCKSGPEVAVIDLALYLCFSVLFIK